LWMAVSSLVVWMQLADFGISNGLSNALAEAYGRDDPEAAGSYLSSAFVATLLIAFLCLPLLVAAYIAVPWGAVLNIADPTLQGQAHNALFVVGLAFIVNIPLSLAGRAYVAYQRGYIPSLAQAAAAMLSFFGIWLAVHAGLDLLWLVAISAFTPVVVNFVLWTWLSRLDPRLRLGLHGIHRRALKRVADSSAPLFFFQCGALLVNQLVNVMIARVANLSAVTDYNVILRIYLFVFSVAAALSSPFYAAIREAFERGDGPWVTRAVRHSLVFRLVATLPFVLILVPLGDPIVRWWIGKGMAEPIAPAGWLCVGLSLVLSATSSLLSEVLSSLDDIWTQIRQVFLSALTVLGLMYVFIPRLGVPGVFLAMALSTLFPIAWAARRLRNKFGLV